MEPILRRPNRRIFLLTFVASGSALAGAGAAAQSAPVHRESDPQAAALGYRADATRVDAAKYPQHTAAQICSGCNFFQGQTAAAQAPCQLFAGKQVMAKGWCSGWVKKAA